MNKQPMFYGIAGLVIGVVLTGLVMSNTRTTMPTQNTMMAKPTMMENSKTSSMSMKEMMDSLKGKTGEEFDKVFITAMIEHHQGAIDMAKEAQMNAGRQEIKKMADDIISAQTSEIAQMKQWQKDWGFTQ